MALTPSQEAALLAMAWGKGNLGEICVILGDFCEAKHWIEASLAFDRCAGILYDLEEANK